MSGAFIVIDGPDGSGKSRVCRTLEHLLLTHGHSVCLTREPYLPTTRAWLFDDKVSPREMAIAFAHDRARHLHEVVRPALAAGQTVVCDRYVLSTIVYQTRHVGPAFVADLIAETPEPALTIIVDTPADVCMARQKAAGKALDRFEGRIELQQAVRLEYLRLARERGYPVIGGDASPGAVAGAAWELVRACVSEADAT